MTVLMILAVLSGGPVVEGPTLWRMLASQDHDVPAAAPPPVQPAGVETVSPSLTPPAPPAGTIPEHWLELARCESGNWHDGGASFSGPIRWDWGAPDMELPPWGTDLHHGGLQFAPSTWEWVAGDLGLLDLYPHAYDAPPEIQVQVAAEVQARQSWEAWPTCARKVGLLR